MKRRCILALMALFFGASPVFSAPATKPTCAVLTFDAKGGVTKDEAAMLTDRFSVELDKSRVYQLTSRDKQNEILKEQRFARSENCSATDCAIEAGKLLGAQFMVYGSVGRVGKTFAVNAYVVDVENGSTVKTATEDFSGEIDDVLKYGMNVVASKLAGVEAPASGGGSVSVGGANLDALLARVKSKEAGEGRVERERQEDSRRLAEELAKRKSQFEREYAQYREVVGSPQADETTKRQAWQQICKAWGVQGAGDKPGGLVLDGQKGLLKAVAGLELGLESAWVNSFGMEFVKIPGTEVLFCKWETRVKDYQAFVAATRHEWPKADFDQGPTHPAVNVSWDDAKAFCEWLTEKERREGKLNTKQAYRLPTDWEWSEAVGLRESRDGSPEKKDMKVAGVYPWNQGKGTWPPQSGAGNYNSSLHCDTYDFTSPVGSFDVNANGLYDLSGNVWEWCEDYYNARSGSRVARGGSWNFSDMWFLLSSYRLPSDPSARSNRIGFRVVVGNS